MAKIRWLARDDIAWTETELGFAISTDDVALVRMVDGTIHTKKLGHHTKHKEWAEFIINPPETTWDRLLDDDDKPSRTAIDDLEPPTEEPTEVSNDEFDQLRDLFGV